MNSSLLLDAIKKNNSLIDRINSYGYKPSKVLGDRYVYSCPFHGPERTPSFFVFTNCDEPHFHCFGCKKHGDVINFVSLHEKCTLRQAIGALASGIDIPYEQILDEAAKIKTEEHEETIEDIAFFLAKKANAYLMIVDRDEQEFEFIEKLFSKIEPAIQIFDIKYLQTIRDLIVNENLFSRRAFQYQYQKRKQESDERKRKIKYD